MPVIQTSHQGPTASHGDLVSASLIGSDRWIVLPYMLGDDWAETHARAAQELAKLEELKITSPGVPVTGGFQFFAD